MHVEPGGSSDSQNSFQSIVRAPNPSSRNLKSGCSSNHIPIVVLKFGSSALRDDPSLARTVHDIYSHIRRGQRVFAVVSAFPGTTDGLIDSARRCSDEPDPACLAGLLATGETAAAAMLGMALDQAGVPAMVLDPVQAGFVVSGPPLEAEPAKLNAGKIRRMLKTYPVVVFPGFFGRTVSDSIALLGRGGSDYTALFAARQLGAAQCDLVKDVDGLYVEDPNAGAGAARFSRISWEGALRLGGRVIQPRALRFARDHGLEFTVRAPLSRAGTFVGAGPVQKGSKRQPVRRPLRVALLGLGTVGLGVYQYFAAHGEDFQVTGIAVKHPHKPRHPAVSATLLTDDPWSLLRQPADAVVELIGGLHPATALIQAALQAGAHVVTANKAVIARHGEKLEQLADSQGVQLKFSASVGGSLPALETVRQSTAGLQIDSLSGVVNSTCNFILDRLAEGIDLHEAVCEAQEKGFAEADTSRDLSGADSADKLAILARAAFGAALAPENIRCRGIEELNPSVVSGARARGRVVRLVASCRRVSRGLKAEVRPVELRANHPLAQTAGPENRLLLKFQGGSPMLLTGKGAGRWPTSLAVLGDLLELPYLTGDQRTSVGGVSSNLAESIRRKNS